MLAAVLLMALSACSAGPSGDPSPTPPPVDRSSLDASVSQFRFDEGTRRLRAGVSNDGRTDIRVSRATIVWGGLAFPTVAVGGDVVRPTQTAAFTIEYGAPRCGQVATGRPRMVAVVDGRTLRLPLHVDQPGLLDRLRDKACASGRLSRVAGVDLHLGRTARRVHGGEYLPGEVVVDRRPDGFDGADEPAVRVRLVDLGGSVLLDLVSRAGRSALPATLRPASARLAFPVLLGSTRRCDAHARGQSSQTFLISAYVRAGADPVQRVVLALSPAERERLNQLMDRVCR